MRLCLLQCDHVDEEFLGIAGNYDAMFRSLFAEFEDVTLEAFDLTNGEFPEARARRRLDGYLTTGSRRSVTEKHDWIVELESLVRALHAERRRFVGICFGHQMIAQALGG